MCIFLSAAGIHIEDSTPLSNNEATTSLSNKEATTPLSNTEDLSKVILIAFIAALSLLICCSVCLCCSCKFIKNRQPKKQTACEINVHISAHGSSPLSNESNFIQMESLNPLLGRPSPEVSSANSDIPAPNHSYCYPNIVHSGLKTTGNDSTGDYEDIDCMQTPNEIRGEQNFFNENRSYSLVQLTDDVHREIPDDSK